MRWHARDEEWEQWKELDVSAQSELEKAYLESLPRADALLAQVATKLDWGV